MCRCCGLRWALARAPGHRGESLMDVHLLLAVHPPLSRYHLSLIVAHGVGTRVPLPHSADMVSRRRKEFGRASICRRMAVREGAGRAVELVVGLVLTLVQALSQQEEKRPFHRQHRSGI